VIAASSHPKEMMKMTPALRIGRRRAPVNPSIASFRAETSPIGPFINAEPRRENFENGDGPLGMRWRNDFTGVGIYS
jgi:hypothetical protein